MGWEHGWVPVARVGRERLWLRLLYAGKERSIVQVELRVGHDGSWLVLARGFTLTSETLAHLVELLRECAAAESAELDRLTTQDE